jgi:hypothetical protein
MQSLGQVKNSILSVKSENESREAGESWFGCFVISLGFIFISWMQSSGIWHL